RDAGAAGFVRSEASVSYPASWSGQAAGPEPGSHSGCAGSRPYDADQRGARPGQERRREQIAHMKLTIRAMDKQVEALEEKYPEIAILRTVPGVGPLVAACYVL